MERGTNNNFFDREIDDRADGCQPCAKSSNLVCSPKYFKPTKPGEPCRCLPIMTSQTPLS